MSYGKPVESPLDFAERHNADLTAETERRLRIATRDAWLSQICMKVARESIMASFLRAVPQVEVRLQA